MKKLDLARGGSCGGWAAAAGAALLLAGAGPAAAEDGRFELRRGMREWGVSAGYGFKVPLGIYDDRTDNRFVTVIPSYGRFLTSRLELVFEAPVTVFTGPDTAFAFGPTAVLRQHFARGGKVIPFAEIGAGFVLTDIDVPELGGPFQFSLQAGAGLRVPIEEHSSLLFGARWFHLSNGGTREPNSSLNNILVTVGVTRTFR
jgi:hypothetical protein